MAGVFEKNIPWPRLSILVVVIFSYLNCYLAAAQDFNASNTEERK